MHVCGTIEVPSSCTGLLGRWSHKQCPSVVCQECECLTIASWVHGVGSTTPIAHEVYHPHQGSCTDISSNSWIGCSKLNLIYTQIFMSNPFWLWWEAQNQSGPQRGQGLLQWAPQRRAQVWTSAIITSEAQEQVPSKCGNREVLQHIALPYFIRR